MVEIKAVTRGSYAEENSILAGDFLAEVNGNKINDIIDYQFYITEKRLDLLLIRDGESFSISFEKPEYSDIGLEFETYLMDEKRHCKNGCIFCFIDQNPKGMRETIYFKDDDERLSFLFGNYITLTNLLPQDVERIIKMRISPVNISVHTTNPALRVQMMKNKYAGDALNILKKLCKNGIIVNVQIVLCQGYNDGDELISTMNDLKALFPTLQSVAIVPAGITKFRESLTLLKPYDKESAKKVLKQILEYGDDCVNSFGHRLFFPADEFFILAKEPLPNEDFYEGYLQLGNGVGMLRLFREEFIATLTMENKRLKSPRKVAVVTGQAAYSEIKELCKRAEDFFTISKKGSNTKMLTADVFAIKNNFFGENITVSGLVVGSDIVNQFKGSIEYDEVLLPESMLRNEGDLFLDDMSLEELEAKIGLKISVIENDGGDFFYRLSGLYKS